MLIYHSTTTATSARTRARITLHHITSHHITSRILVYAFGIILWEILARTAPYFNLGLSMPEVGIAVIMDNLRPAVPQDTAAPPAYVALMRECWAPSPADRPSFTQSTLFPLCLSFCRWMEYIHVGSALIPLLNPPPHVPTVS